MEEESIVLAEELYLFGEYRIGVPNGLLSNDVETDDKIRETRPVK